ncbi:hypothetical protein J7I97_21085 [Streptomyces sp. ISL-87]|nr:hypothetical protein [Streptomyces sp. ISL-21]MBT2457062.1 hypothetical protein [Streptomyces sp. ISL-86]MBT2610692.1 hypothetical protein [Streptomyces sp. ISL-87]
MRSGGAVGRGAAEQTGGHQSAAAAFRAESVIDGRWLTRGLDGRLTAYARTSDGLLRWTETQPGGPQWKGPEFFPAPHIASLSVAQGADGFIHFVGRRTLQGKGGSTTVDLAHAIQYQSGRPLAEWQSLGNPHRDPARAPFVGDPVVAVAASGATYVFIGNASGALAVRRESAAGKWRPWQGIKGKGVRADMAPVSLASGLIEALVPMEPGAMRCCQPEQDADLLRVQDLQIAPAEYSAVGLETAPGRVTYYWSDPATTGLFAYRAGGWVIPLGGTAAPGRIAALRTMIDGYDCTVLAHRGLDGQVVLGAFGTENEGAGVWWSPTGEWCAEAPALTLDHYGRVVVAFLDAEGGLRVARQGPEGGFAMEPSVRI